MAAYCRRLAAFLGLRRGMVGLLGMVVLVGVGENMAERFVPLYLIALGGGEILIGIVAGLDDLLSALYSFPGGYLSDRLGTKRALLVFNLLAMAGYVPVILIRHWAAVIVGTVLFISWSAISLPASMELVSKVLPPKKHVMGVTMHSLVRRLPMALGPMLGGAMIAWLGVDVGVRASFGCALVLALVALVLQQKLIPDDRRQPGEEKPAAPGIRALWAEMSPQLRNLLVSDILIRFCERMPWAFAVVWATRLAARPVTEWQFGLLTGIEMATAVLIYLPVAWAADRFTKKPFVLITFGFFTAFPLVLMHSQSFWPLVVAFVVRGLKEFGEPTRKSLILELAPADRKAAMFGLYYLVRDILVSLAAFAGGPLWKHDPRLCLWTAFAFGVAGTAWFAAFGRDLGRASEEPPAG